jgi:alpha-L-arabinofuranosidase
LNGDITAQSDLQPFIDDALDQIEFIRGPVTTKWGAVRASLGHPEPFALKYVEVGNEDWLAGGEKGWTSYKEYRFPLFMDAIRKAHPDIIVIASGATSDGHQIPAPAIGDYHPYREPDQLVNEYNRFDNDKVGHIVGEEV